MVAASLDAAVSSGAIDAIVLVVPAGYEQRADVAALVEPIRARLPVEIAPGGTTRLESVRFGLRRMSGSPDVVVVHDAARPFASPELFARVVGTLRDRAPADRVAGVIPVVPSPDTVKRARGGRVLGTLPRDDLVLSQTPQAFLATVLIDAHASAGRSGSRATDDAMLLEAVDQVVVTVAGEASNAKITTPEDLFRADRLMADRQAGAEPASMVRSPDDMARSRVGFGFDTHPFDEDRPLYLGGIRFDDAPGLAGHSDGDAVCHAICDALLGAIAAGDVGQHFPDTDPSIAGISGTALVARTVTLIGELGVQPASCDVTVLAERPAIGPLRDEMRQALATAMGLDVDTVSVKATRPEGLGLTGAGIGCMALVTVVDRDPT